MSHPTVRTPVALGPASQEFREAASTSLTIDSGWREVAERALAFVKRFA